MQKHQKANFWTAEYVCVQQRWLKREHNARFMTCHILKCAFTFNFYKLKQCELGKTLLLFNSKALSVSRSEHQSHHVIS